MYAFNHQQLWQARFHITSTMKTALLIIDLQKSTRPAPDIVAAIEQLQYQYEFVYASRFVNAASPLIKFDVFDGYDDESLAFTPAEHVKIFAKNIYSSFIPEMRAFERIDLCGYDTDACVYKTAMDLIENGVRPRVLTRLCGSENAEFHELGLKALARNIGDANLIE